MKYIYLNLIAFFGFIGTFLAVYFGHFANINIYVNSLPRISLLVWPFFFITDIGGLFIISLGSIFLLIFLAIKDEHKKILYTAISLIGALLSQTLIKNFTLVARPQNGLVSSFGYAFPSGHSNMSAVLFLSLCFYVFSNIIDGKKRKLYYGISILIILLVGFSRIYLNVHWVSDVLAGWCLGMFWATLPLAFVSLKNVFRSEIEIGKKL